MVLQLGLPMRFPALVDQSELDAAQTAPRLRPGLWPGLLLAVAVLFALA